MNYNSTLLKNLEELGFLYDSSLRNSKDKIDASEMGFFRSGKILEYPVTLMDAYLFTHMKIGENEIIPTFQSTLELSRSISENHVFTIIWHDNVLKMKGGRMYEKILEFLTSQNDVQIIPGRELVGILKD